uniref:Glycoside-hydrolase family GH114 TIM-barrel domain-containing protein n=2 Tax=Magallana gigas TaxID=29159 RepID=A0A8W8JYK2_MAGGI|nr:uncharacterized protein LOC105329279 [Crassostrea gigas]
MFVLHVILFTLSVVEVFGSYWHPHQHMSWNNVVGEILVNSSIHEDVYVVDLFDRRGIIPGLLSKGKKVVCYFSAGTYEDWRPDIGQFPPDALGNGVTTWRGERWVDIRDTRIRDVMRKRIQMAQQQGCHGVDPGNVDGYTQSDLGFNLTYDNQIDYNRFLASEAHNHGLAIGLKNDLLQIKDLLHDFDFAINESCEQFRYNVQKNCLLYQPFFDARKPVFHIEYVRSSSAAHAQRNAICSNRPSDMNTIIKVALTNYKVDC